MTDFSTKAHAKFILTGEHAVIRGHGAIVMPLKTKNIHLTFKKNTSKLKVNVFPDTEDGFNKIPMLLLERAASLLGQDLSNIHGKITISSNIPAGKGLGLSAALCVVLTRLLVWWGWLDSKQLLGFATQLENYFHHQSSGADIIGVCSENAVKFNNIDDCEIIQAQWQPHLFLYYSGHASSTSICVKKVNSYVTQDVEHARAIDSIMAMSVKNIAASLLSAQSVDTLAEEITNAADCFRDWGLVPKFLEEKIRLLHDYGAVAVKPTGAGMGGFLLGLWAEDPEPQYKKYLIATG